MSGDTDLKLRCHVNRGDTGDRFVGVRIDTDGAVVCFPMGYHLPESDEEIRQDILQLIDVLSVFGDIQGGTPAERAPESPGQVNFPMNAYLSLIRRFLEQGAYYTEREQYRKTADRGRIDWAASLRRNVAFFQEDGAPFFDRYTVKGSLPNENHLITQVHKFCVYESFRALGWLFTSYMPPDPHIEKDTPRFLYALRKKAGETYNDNDRRLLTDMISVILYLDCEHNRKQSCFGTDRFEYVWEKLIDEIFGIRGKEAYFPRTDWRLKYDRDRENHALEPDSIMVCGGRVYVLDAKYYRYGVTGDKRHLPQSAFINKQITYGEYVAGCRAMRDRFGDAPVYNAFLMPYDMYDNPFETRGKNFVNIGEAVSQWKRGKLSYEKVQGIVVDTRFLLKHYSGLHKSEILELAKMIEDALAENAGAALPDGGQPYLE